MPGKRAGLCVPPPPRPRWSLTVWVELPYNTIIVITIPSRVSRTTKEFRRIKKRYRETELREFVRGILYSKVKKTDDFVKIWKFHRAYSALYTT